MYERHFGLSQPPFSIAPDPRYLFMSERHREALAHLLYGVRGGGGFVVLTGDIGAGKTTICRCFLEQVPERCNVAYIFNPKLTVEELLRTVCDEFRVPYRHDGPGALTVKDYVDALNDFLLRAHAAGQDNVLIIDEAQNLSAELLEQLRLLTNLETNERKLLQIVLIGQPELRAMLARPELEQLSQRVIARYHLDALAEDETAEYVRHRLAVAGLARSLPFDRKALRRIWRYSRGVPRRINLLCDRALLGAYAKGMPEASARIVDLAADEVLEPGGESPKRSGHARNVGVALLVAVAAAAAIAFALNPSRVGDTARRWVAAPAAPHGPAPAKPNARAAVAGAAANPPPSAAKPAVAQPEAARPAAATVAPTGAATGSAGGSAAASADLHAGPAGDATASAAPTGAVAPRGPRTPEPPLFDLPAGFESLIGTGQRPMRDLARLWGVVVGTGDACAQAATHGLRCFERTEGTLALIRQLDRPVVLKLRDGRGRVAFAVMVGLLDRSALLAIDGTVRSVPLLTLAGYWRGDFETYWRVPPERALPGGKPAPDPRWLARRLAQARGERIADDAPVDGRTLHAWIYTFQLANGLDADGVAGPLTIMMLNRATGVDEPRLRNGK